MQNNLTQEVLKLRKVTIRDYNLELISISNIEIFESLSMPGITGYISFKDYQAFQELGNVFADDDIKISFSVDDDEANELVLNFKIFTNEGSRQLPLNTYDVIRYGFCSPWLVEGIALSTSKPYENKKISEIVEDLLKECGAEIGFIEPTKQTLETFVTPFWSPYRSIKYLLSFAMNEESVGGYICWTDLKTGKVNVTTLDYVLKGNLGHYKGDNGSGFNVYPANIRYSGRVKNMTVEASFDSIRMIDTGVPDTKFYAFNFDKKQIMKSKDNIITSKQTRLSKKFPLLQKYTDKKYANHKFLPIFPQTADSIASDDSKLTDIIDGVEKNTYSFLTTDVFKINIEAIGEINRRVGWLADLDYPSVGANANKDNDTVGNKQMKGTYLIREIKHQFSLSQDYTQYITLVSDGFKEYTRDLITW